MKPLKNARLLKIATIFAFFTGCSVIKPVTNQIHLKRMLEKSEFFSGHFTGFCLYDPESDEYLYSWNRNNYFTLASNTKLLTFYAALKCLGDSIPGMLYEFRNDTLLFSGTGDPTQLHATFPHQPVLNLLNDTSHTLAYVPADFEDSPFAPGWAWEDYQYYFQPERSSLPLYGNTVSVVFDSTKNEFRVEPPFFNDFVELSGETFNMNRLQLANIFSFVPDTSRSAYKNSIPFITSESMVIRLLEDTLKRPVALTKDSWLTLPDTIYSTPTLDVLAYMLKASDNHIAEQLQYVCAVQLGMTLNSELVRETIKDTYFSTLSDPPIWKDGSGLSRYNLATPEFMVQLLVLISKELPIETVKQLLAVGGRDGTLKNWYTSEGAPYIFAKTGTLSNNHNLTGIIRTQSGKDLFFSFMNNNYASGSYPVKKEMEKVMSMIRDNF